MTKEKHVLSLESLFSICRYLYPASEEWPDVREVHKHDLTREVMLFSRLAPYLDQAYDQFTDADAPEILCKAIEAARADGMQIPQLTVETGYRIKSVKIVPNGENPDKKKKPKTAAEAREIGAITSLENHAASIGMKKFAGWCDEWIKETPEALNGYSYGENGQILSLSFDGEKLTESSKKNPGLMMVIQQLVYLRNRDSISQQLQQAIQDADPREYNGLDSPVIPIHLPSFYREIGKDPRGQVTTKTADGKEVTKKLPLTKEDRAKDFIRLVTRPNEVGYIKGDGIYPTMIFWRWDENTDTAYISAPYAMRIEFLAKAAAKNHAAIAHFFHANIAGEDPIAVEIANSLAIGLMERGIKRTDNKAKEDKPQVTKCQISKEGKDGSTITKDIKMPEKKTITYNVRFDKLIAQCPSLQSRIDAIKANTEITAQKRANVLNKLLESKFNQAIDILLNKSDALQYYANLTIFTSCSPDKFAAPTYSKLKTEYIFIRHNGKNPNYKA